MTALAVRPLLSAALVTLAFGGATLAGAPAAVAAPGDEGDIKVHHAGRPGEVSRTGENSPVNNPSVCTFYFAAFDFDGLQSINWAITPQPPVDSVTTSGSIPIDAAGYGISPDLTLADGRYKVEWTWEGQQGPEKSKIFRVDCDDSAGPPPTNGNGGNRGAAGAAANSGNGGTGNGSTASSSSANGGTANGSSSWNGGTGSATGNATSSATGGTGSWNGGTGSATGNATSSATGGTGSWNGGTGNATSSATGGTGSWNGGTGNGGTGNGASPSSTSSANGWTGGSAGGATKPPQGPVGAGGGGSADTTGTDGSAFGVGSAIAAALAGTVGLILVRRSRRRTDGAA